MALDQQQSDLIVGTLLGDGNLQTDTKGRTWRYRALQEASHLDYIKHKYNILQPLCTTGPIYGSTLDPRTRAIYERWYFNTKVDPSLTVFGNMFYTYDPISNKMVKDVPKNIEKWLTPRAIAYWYMDDGALKWEGHSNAMRICTESFSVHGVQRLQTALKDLHGIPTSLVKKHKTVNNVKVLVGCRIAINEKASSDFRNLIQPYLVDCMKYKVSDGNKGHL